MQSSGLTSRGRVGGTTLAMYVAGICAFITGLYLCSTTRIYLDSGESTHPYLGIGLVLAVVGLGVTFWTKFAAKRALHR